MVAVSVKGVMPTSNGCAVFLGNDVKTFVIYMDRTIGNAIQRAVNAEEVARPMTHDLMLTILEGLGANVERVVINNVEKGTFFARLIVSMDNELGQKIIEVDTRPSDSIVLALSSKKPLYVAKKVFETVDDMSEILAKIIRDEE